MPDIWKLTNKKSGAVVYYTDEEKERFVKSPIAKKYTVEQLTAPVSKKKV